MRLLVARHTLFHLDGTATHDDCHDHSRRARAVLCGRRLHGVEELAVDARHVAGRSVFCGNRLHDPGGYPAGRLPRGVGRAFSSVTWSTG